MKLRKGAFKYTLPTSAEISVFDQLAPGITKAAANTIGKRLLALAKQV